MEAPGQGAPAPGGAPAGGEGGGGDLVSLLGDIQNALGILSNVISQAQGVPPEIVQKTQQVTEMYNSLVQDVQAAAGGQGAPAGAVSPETGGKPATQPVG